MKNIWLYLSLVEVAKIVSGFDFSEDKYGEKKLTKNGCKLIIATVIDEKKERISQGFTCKWRLSGYAANGKDVLADLKLLWGA